MKNSISDLQRPRHQSINIWGTNFRDRHVHHQKTWWLTRDDIKMNCHCDTAPVIARSLLPVCPVRCKSYGVIARNPELVEGDEAISAMQ